MRVQVKLHAILRDYRPPGFKGDVLNVVVEEGATVLTAIEHLGIPRKVLHAAFLNDQQVGVDATLKEGDFLRLFPPVVGGSSASPRLSQGSG
ncbi:MAG TPA: MoaD/ThiS family protein [Anaerolineae bacterium]